MIVRKLKTGKLMLPLLAAAALTAALIAVGCTAGLGSSAGTTVASTSKTLVPVSLTDAPSDQVLAASLTINSVVLTDSSGATASVLSAPFTFEAAHLDAVQEPLLTPSIPEDTYASVTLTYSNAQVAYFDTTTGKIVLVTGTLANTPQTITFTSPITVSNTSTGLLIDYLVANSVTISGSTVDVAPEFNVSAVSIAAQPTNGLNGLQCGVNGQVTALGTGSFTLETAEGTSLTIYVNSSTVYQGLSGFSALAVDAFVQVDTQTQTNGELLAVRISEQGPPPAKGIVLVGPVTAVTGSPATSFTQIVRQQVGPNATANPVQVDTIAIDSSTTFQLPYQLNNLSGGTLPFTATFSAATLFAGQNVAVATNSVSDNAATATSVTLAPQTVNGTIASITTGSGGDIYTLTLNSTGWLAKLTGLTTVTVYTNSNLKQISSTTPAVGSTIRFHGFLFESNGSLVLLADVQAPPPGQPMM
jgi:hypothetical protein